MKHGIAFSGGGIKSISQIALVGWLEDNGIVPDCVAGTSAGSLIAAMLAMGLDAQTIKEEVKAALIEIEERHIMKVSGIDLLFNKELKHGMIDAQRIEGLIQEICDKYAFNHISEAKIPLAITAVDLYTGELIVFVSHPHLYKNTHRRTQVISDISFAKAMRASMTFPLIFASTFFEERYLIDGGVRMNCPVPMVKDYGASKVMAVTMRDAIHETEPLDKTLQVVNRIYDLMSREAEYRNILDADLILNLPVSPVNIFDVSMGESIYDLGVETILQEKDALDAFFKPRSLSSKIRRFIMKRK